MRSIIFALLLSGGVALGFQFTVAADDTPPDPLEPLNAEDIDYPVPWGLRYGKSARLFMMFDVNEDGEPVNIRIVKSKYTNTYDTVAKQTVSKLRYPPGEYRKGLKRELHYCVLDDGATPIACEVKFKRLTMDGKPVPKTDPLDWEASSYAIDSFAGNPRAKGYVLPYYPFRIRGKKPTRCGWVRVHFDLDTKGRPQHIEAVESGGDGVFNNNVKYAFKKFRFETGTDVREMEYLVSMELPGRCRLEEIPAG